MGDCSVVRNAFPSVYTGIGDCCTFPGIVCSNGSSGRVTALYLYDAKLGGTIPGGLDALTELTALNLGKNGLTGQIPASLGNFQKLTWLALHDNSLSGPIPAELGRLTTLQKLDIFNNKFTGPIPESIARLPNLITFAFNDNAGLSGTMPNGFPALLACRGQNSGVCTTSENLRSMCDVKTCLITLAPPAATATSTATAVDSKASDGLPVAAIAGGVVGGVAVIAGIIAAIFFVRRRNPGPAPGKTTAAGGRVGASHPPAGLVERAMEDGTGMSSPSTGLVERTTEAGADATAVTKTATPATAPLRVVADEPAGDDQEPRPMPARARRTNMPR
ncbi:hypothetical protein BC831DRAFT_511742 [Entophlyctis helioformis]|nr:hypothetical protein BC831DRAFT_511742 [Entophlyctis helioformis]